MNRLATWWWRRRIRRSGDDLLAFMDALRSVPVDQVLAARLRRSVR